MEKRICSRCKGDRISSLGGKIFECDECGYLFREYNDSEDVMLKISEYTLDDNITDTLFWECMVAGSPITGRVPVFGKARLHIMVKEVTSDEVMLIFCYRNAEHNRKVTVTREQTYVFIEFGYKYQIEFCTDEQ